MRYYEQDMKAILEQSLELMKNCVQPALEECLYNPRFNINFLAKGIRVDDEILLVEKMIPVVFDLMDRLCLMSKVSKSESFENPIVLSWMATAFLDRCFPPPKWFTTFEFRRLHFSHTGALKGQNKERVKMVVGSF
jgi:hypothetical protein